MCAIHLYDWQCKRSVYTSITTHDLIRQKEFSSSITIFYTFYIIVVYAGCYWLKCHSVAHEYSISIFLFCLSLYFTTSSPKALLCWRETEPEFPTFGPGLLVGTVDSAALYSYTGIRLLRITSSWLHSCK